MTITYSEIAEIIKLIEASSCDELVLETGDLKLVVRRHGAAGDGGVSAEAGASTDAPSEAASLDGDFQTPGPFAPPPPQPGTVAAGSGGSGGAAQKAKPAPQPKPPRGDGMVEVRAPMVGTFYRAPTPDADPFVEAGADVGEGDPLCLIEVMKLFTTISARQPGRVVEICAENATLVEYDQVLLVLEPA